MKYPPSYCDDCWPRQTAENTFRRDQEIVYLLRRAPMMRQLSVVTCEAGRVKHVVVDFALIGPLYLLHQLSNKDVSEENDNLSYEYNIRKMLT